jgi:23S rRNA (cytidine1920-2'-O)/16S rRNA (cytidine1409-2'-O)-methyltransferase
MPTDRSPRKLRVDQALVDRGLVESRARAQALVLAGLVFCGETKIAKPGQTIPPRRRWRCAGAIIPGSAGAGSSWPMPSTFALDPTGATAMDIGSSTGALPMCC